MKIRHVWAMCLFIYPVAQALAAPELSGDPVELNAYLSDQQKLIVVQGSGEVKTQANSALISLRVKTVEEKFSTALKKNKTVRENIWKKIISGGVPADKVQVAKFSSTPNYGWFGNKPSSYAVFNEIKISIENEEQLFIIAGIVDEFKEVQLGAMEFLNTQATAATKTAIETALKEIADKKKLYEIELGVVLIPINLVENTTIEQMRLNESVPQKRVLGSYSTSQDFDSEKIQSFGEQTFTSTVAVKYTVKGR